MPPSKKHASPTVRIPAHPKIAMAIGAHPDDIEFLMAGTLLKLKQCGYEIHYLNLASGNCGSMEHDAETITRIRSREAHHAASILGSRYYPPFCRDLEILYDLKTLRRLAAVIRSVKPNILLTQSPNDYMEDHQNTCRLAVTAAFTRGAPNFVTIPRKVAGQYDLTLYHSMPHGLKDGLGRRVLPGCFVDITSVHGTKLAALKAHRSQQNWLGATQKMNSYIQTMVDMDREIGRQSKKFKLAEGWRRHSPFGFCDPAADPLQDLGADYLPNAAYRNVLEKGY